MFEKVVLKEMSGTKFCTIFGTRFGTRFGTKSGTKCIMRRENGYCCIHRLPVTTRSVPIIRPNCPNALSPLMRACNADALFMSLSASIAGMRPPYSPNGLCGRPTTAGRDGPLQNKRHYYSPDHHRTPFSQYIALQTGPNDRTPVRPIAHR